MWVLYALVQNVGWAIILFTIIVRAAMFPISLKQQKSTAVSQLFMPKVREIQTKYKNDQQKQQEELMKLQKEGYNPTGGCLPYLLSFLILFGVIDVVYKPMTHMEHFSAENINAIVTAAKEVEIAQTLLTNEADYNTVIDYIADSTTNVYTEWEEMGPEGKPVKRSNRNTVPEGFDIETAKSGITVTPEILDKLAPLFDREKGLVMLGELYGNSSKLSDVMRSNLQSLVVGNYSDQSLYRELRTLNCYKRSDTNKQLIVSRSGISTEVANKLDNLSKNLIFFGLNLGDQPRWEFNALLIVPLLAFIFSFAQIIIQQHLTNKQNPELAKQQGSMKILLLMTPLLSLFIAFSVPAGAGFYWSVSALVGIAQSVIMYKFWPSDKIREEAIAKSQALREQKEQRTTIITVEADGTTTEKTERISKLTQKEIKELNKKKLEAARKADAEKYGEEYIPSPDDDD